MPIIPFKRQVLPCHLPVRMCYRLLTCSLTDPIWNITFFLKMITNFIPSISICLQQSTLLLPPTMRLRILSFSALMADYLTITVRITIPSILFPAPTGRTLNSSHNRLPSVFSRFRPKIYPVWPMSSPLPICPARPPTGTNSWGAL